MSGVPTRGTGPSRVPLEVQYRLWRLRIEPGAAGLRELAAASASRGGYASLVFVIPPTDGPGPLSTTLASLRDQPHQRWRAAFALPGDGAFPVGAPDPRAIAAVLEPDGDWAVALLDAASPEAGEYVALVPPGARVTPHGLVLAAATLAGDPDCDLLYTDWDELGRLGHRNSPHFAYGWSPELLLGRDQDLGGLVLQRQDLLSASGGWRASEAPVEAYAQLLRAAARARRPRHLPVVALSRSRPARPAPTVEERRHCVKALLTDRGTAAEIKTRREPEVTDVRWEVIGSPLVDVIIPTRDRLDLLRRCLAGLDRTAYPARRVLIVDNDSRDAATLEFLAAQPHRVLRHPGAFNYSAIVNHAAAASDAPYLLLLNNDVEVLSPGWLGAMLGWCQQPGIGAVGARLLFADGRVQHEGIGIGIGRVAANLELGWSATRACSAVTGACMLIRRSAFQAVGGFDEGLPVVFNDVDFCLRLWAAGWRVVMTPLAELRHDEGSSRGALAPEEDYRRFCERWGEAGRLRDAFLGPHIAWPRPLTLRIPPRRRRRTA